MEHGGDIYGNQNIELDFSVNLSPIGPPEGVLKALKGDDMQKALTSYPDPQYRELRAALSKKLAIPEEWLLCGNGASELLTAAVQAVRPGRAVIPVPTYLGYERVLEAVDAQILFCEMDREKGFALTDDLFDDRGGLKELAESSRGSGSNSMLFLCNPNNPVGNCIDPALLNKIAEYCRTEHIYLVVDECYLDLLPDVESRTKLPALADNPYLIIVSAFTKTYAMPGVRLGYLMTSNSELRAKIQLQQPEWSVSMLAQKAGIAALRDKDYLNRARQAIRMEREYICEKLRESGAEVFEGEGPFVLFISGKELYEPLKERGILIRRCGGIRGIRNEAEDGGSAEKESADGGHYYRVGVKSHDENVRLMRSIGEIMGL